MEFPKRLRQLRKFKSVSQKILGDYIGVTRQAIAAYEGGKRQPDFNILILISDYFNVSTDYLLGRVSLKQQGVYTVGKNIQILKGNMTLKEFSEDIGKKTDILISYDKLNDYIEGKDEPNISILKVLAKYGEVSLDFFNDYHIKESWKKTTQIKNDVLLNDSVLTNECEKKEVISWFLSEDNGEYVSCLKEIKDSGISVLSLKFLVDCINQSKL